jgi:hypothetical protein
MGMRKSGDRASSEISKVDPYIDSLSKHITAKKYAYKSGNVNHLTV